MPAPFKQLTRDQFAVLLEKFDFTRRITAVHMHHTWRPNHGNYDKSDGHKTILGMYRYHTQEKQWQDIAQHITIAPDGTIWLGRNWNWPPVSAAGHNGNTEAGPFMFEIIGDFDQGCDPFAGEQRKTTLEVIARVQKKFKLTPDTLKFHNSMARKSCPGTAINHAAILAAVRELHEKLARPAAATRGAKRKAPGRERLDPTVKAVLDSLPRNIPRQFEPADAEPA